MEKNYFIESEEVDPNLLQSAQTGIAEHVIDEFHTSLRSISSPMKRLPTCHVSDLVNPCLRKVKYSKDPKLRKTPDRDAIKAVSVGIMVHENTSLGIANELTMSVDVVDDRSYSKNEVLSMTAEERKNIVTGTLDDLVKIGPHWVIVDKKTYNGKWHKKTEANAEHCLQVDCYAYFLRKAYGINSPFGVILYLDKSNDLEPTPIVFRISPIEKTRKFMQESLKKLQSDVLPEPTITFLCDGKNSSGKIYCPYLDQCKKDGGR